MGGLGEMAKRVRRCCSNDLVLHMKPFDTALQHCTLPTAIHIMSIACPATTTTTTSVASASSATPPATKTPIPIAATNSPPLHTCYPYSCPSHYHYTTLLTSSSAPLTTRGCGKVARVVGAVGDSGACMLGPVVCSNDLLLELRRIGLVAAHAVRGKIQTNYLV